MPNRPTPKAFRPLPRNLRLMTPDEYLPPAEPPPKPPAAPAWLTPEAAEHWNEIVKEMIAEKTWRASFTSTLGNYVSLFAVFLQDSEVFSPTKLVTLRLLGADLGLSPSHWHRVARTSQR